MEVRPYICGKLIGRRRGNTKSIREKRYNGCIVINSVKTQTGLRVYAASFVYNHIRVNGNVIYGSHDKQVGNNEEGESMEEKADVVIFSCYIWNISFVRELAAELKKVSPDVKIWAGGPEVSYAANKFLMENPTFDLIMQGEGEEVFELLHVLLNFYRFTM